MAGARHATFVRAAVLRPACCAAACLAAADPAWAVQPHGGPEGLYVHQLGHILFFGAVIHLYVLLGIRERAAHRGWRLLRRSALLFGVWNVLAFVYHLLEVRLASLPGGAGAGLSLPEVWLIHVVSYDNLLLLPAMAYFHLGLRVFVVEGEGRP